MASSSSAHTAAEILAIPSASAAPFAVLGIPPPASLAEVTDGNADGAPTSFDLTAVSKAYRRLSLLYHPDKNSMAEAAQVLEKVQEAYMLLCDDERRTEYFTKVLFGDQMHEQRVKDLQQAALDATARLAKKQTDAAEAEAKRVAMLHEQQRQRAAASSGLGSILFSTANALEKEILSKWEVDSLDVLNTKEHDVLARLERLERGTFAKRNREEDSAQGGSCGGRSAIDAVSRCC